MEKLTLSIARILLNLKSGEALPGSRLSKKWLQLLKQEEILSVQRIGRTKTRISLVSEERMANFLRNKFGIADLEAYVKMLEQKEASGLEASEIASDTKLRHSRTFKGFLVNVIEPLDVVLNDSAFVLNPKDGAFSFIYDYESFAIDPDVKIVGIENPESFRHINRHLHLFPEGKKLFVSRYPQNRDLIRWLQSIPNTYLHFGDLDLAGIAIYENEFSKHLGYRASFIIPAAAEETIAENGSRHIYNQQYGQYRNLRSEDREVQKVIDIIHKLKKGVEQERLVK